MGTHPYYHIVVDGRSYLTTSVSTYHYQSIAPQLTHCTPFAFPLCMFKEASIGYASLKLT